MKASADTVLKVYIEKRLHFEKKGKCLPFWKMCAGGDCSEQCFQWSPEETRHINHRRGRGAQVALQWKLHEVCTARNIQYSSEKGSVL